MTGIERVAEALLVHRFGATQARYYLERAEPPKEVIMAKEYTAVVVQALRAIANELEQEQAEIFLTALLEIEEGE